MRGYLNDPRISGRSRAFHFGIDIVAKDGTPVYAVEAGTVHREGARSLSVVGTDGARAFGYWHIVPAVEHRQQVEKHQLLGHVEAGWAHVHLAESRNGEYRNPLRRGALTPWGDGSSPRIVGVQFQRDGRVLPAQTLSGAVDVIVEAWDLPGPPIAPPWDAAVVTPALLRWRVLRGRTVARPWHTPVDLRSTLLPASRFGEIYAAGTRQNRPGKAGRYRFYLAHTWSTRLLLDGPYRLEVTAEDVRGNTATATQPFGIVNEV